MKTTRKLMFCLIFIAFTANAQNMSKNFLSLSIGASTPSGAYSETSGNNAGFAANGAVLALDGARYFGNLGIAGTLSFGSHQLDKQSLQQAFSQYSKQEIRFSKEKSIWSASCLMAGPAYAVSSGKLTADFRILWGFFFARNPDVNFEDEGQIPEEFWKFNNNLNDCVGAMGFQLGAGVQYVVGKRLALSSRLNFYRSNPAYEMKIQQVNEQGGVTEKNISFRQATEVTDFTFGLAYRFGFIRQ